VEPKRPEHADREQDMGNGYTLVRRLIGYGTRPGVNTTPQFWYELWRDGRKVDEGQHYFPLRWAAKRRQYG
jgi:hypothetical protein